MTLNVWHDAGPWPERKRLIRHWIARLSPDVIGLQELLQGQGVDLLAELGDGLGYHGAFGTAMPFWRDRGLAFGNGVLSRFPIEERHELQLPDAGDVETRAALTLLLNAPFGPLCFSVTHLHWRLHHGHVRVRQVAALSQHVLALQPSGGFPAVIVGDFNAEPDSDEIRYMRGLHTVDGRSVHFRDAYRMARDLRGERDPGFTWDNVNPYARAELEPNRRIDYVFVGYPRRDGLGHLRDCKIVCNEPEADVWPSDHFGLLAELDDGPAS